MFGETFNAFAFGIGSMILVFCLIMCGLALIFAAFLGVDWLHQKWNKYKFESSLRSIGINGGAKREAISKFEELSHTHFSNKVLEAKSAEEFFELPGEIIKPRPYDYGLIKFVVTEHPDVRVFSVWVYYTEHIPTRHIKDSVDFEAVSEWWQLLIAAEHYGVDCSDTAEYIRQQLCAYMREHGALV